MCKVILPARTTKSLAVTGEQGNLHHQYVCVYMFTNTIDNGANLKAY